MKIFRICALFLLLAIIKLFGQSINANPVWSCRALEDKSIEFRRVPLTGKGLLQENIEKNAFLEKLTKGQVLYFNSKQLKNLDALFLQYLKLENHDQGEYFLKYSSVDESIILNKRTLSESENAYFLTQSPKELLIFMVLGFILPLAGLAITLSVAMLLIFYWFCILAYLVDKGFFNCLKSKQLSDMDGFKVFALDFLPKFLLSLAPAIYFFFLTTRKALRITFAGIDVALLKTNKITFRRLMKERLQIAKEKSILIRSCCHFVQHLTAMIECLDQDFPKPETSSLKGDKNDK